MILTHLYTSRKGNMSRENVAQIDDKLETSSIELGGCARVTNQAKPKKKKPRFCERESRTEPFKGKN